MAKILITGGAGFIGSNYAHYRFENHPEDEIFVLDKLTYAGNLDNLADLMDGRSSGSTGAASGVVSGTDMDSADNAGGVAAKTIARFHFIQGDIADKPFIEDFFVREKFDIVVNFAAETHVDRSITGPSIFVQTNIVGTHNLLEAARLNGVKRYHQVSTDEVYGDLGSDSKDFFTESTPLAPNCPYAASKASADLLVRSYFETYQMPVTISRCSNNYGPYQFPEKLVPYFFRLVSEGKKVPVYGDGQNVRDWLYVIDHCRAIDLILEKGRVGDVYNVGGNNERTNLQITKFLLEFLGKDESLITYVDDRLAHDRRYAIDSGKLQRELGWSPSVNFKEGIQKTFDWYQAHKDWAEKLMSKLEERKHKIVSSEPLTASR